MVKKLTSAGVFTLDKAVYNVGAHHGFEQAPVIAEDENPGDKITITDLGARPLVVPIRPLTDGGCH